MDALHGIDAEWLLIAMVTMTMNKDKVADCQSMAGAILATQFLGKAGGLRRLYANIDKILPGGYSCKFHSHSLQEEFFLVLNGSGILRTNDGTVHVKAGDFFCKPAGLGIAHQFINDSNEILEILDVGIPDSQDIIEYPDEGITYKKAENQAFKEGVPVHGWTSDSHL